MHEYITQEKTSEIRLIQQISLNEQLKYLSNIRSATSWQSYDLSLRIILLKITWVITLYANEHVTTMPKQHFEKRCACSQL